MTGGDQGLRSHLPNTPRLAPFIYEQEIRSRELAAIGPGGIAELLKSFM